MCSNDWTTVLWCFTRFYRYHWFWIRFFCCNRNYCTTTGSMKVLWYHWQDSGFVKVLQKFLTRLWLFYKGSTGIWQDSGGSMYYGDSIKVYQYCWQDSGSLRSGSHCWKTSTYHVKTCLIYSKICYLIIFLKQIFKFECLNLISSFSLFIKNPFI